MQKYILSYNDHEVKENDITISKDIINNKNNIWIDITNYNSADLTNLQQVFNLDKDSIEKVKGNSKRPQLMTLDNQKFTILVQLKYKNIENLETNPIYFFVGKKWLITIHSENIDILSKAYNTFLKNNKILQYSIDALYYSLISSIIETYEYLVTAIELKLLDFERDAQYRPSKTTLKNLDLLSKQSIMIRRHFWHARNIISYLKNIEEDKEDIKYLRVVYDDINQLIEMVESYRDTINSTREIFSSSISLQLDETMRILTIISTTVLPISLLIAIFSMDEFDLNNLTIIPRHFSILVVIMVIMIGITLFLFWRKNWLLSKHSKLDDMD
ncbi:MAG TPA: CorA family divalent cation transporter [Nitrososphaeraceae archaeon]|nr:CorA family divalent cation transporter [Nitrososphaeraceae archaeon]